MFNFNLSYKWLRWQQSSAPPPPLPEGIERTFIKTPPGDIEMLYARPATGANGDDHDPMRISPSPLFFVHGGMGGAWVWIEYMQYFSSRGIPCYAVSLRGHGESWHPSFFRMVYCTTKRAMADDLVAGVRWAQEREGDLEVVLVGHSAGGGLSQLVLSEGVVRAKGLVLAAAIPEFGSMGVYMNWWRQDPFCHIRMLFHGGHPNSPLSHPGLTKAVFFSKDIPGSYLLRFQSQMNAYESLLWALGMMRPFVKTASLVRHLGGGGGWGTGQKIMVLGGGGDKLMTVPIMQRLANTYRMDVSRLVETKKVDADADSVIEPLAGEDGLDNAGHGVRFCVVPVAGHHLQNDIQWETGARKLLEFYKQL